MLALVLAAALAAAPSPEGPPAIGLTLVPSLGAGGDVGRRTTTGVRELELGVGWDLGLARPEVALVLGFAPGSYAALRPGVRYDLPDLPFFARGALDWSHEGGDWAFRWLLAGVGAELRLTSAFAGFVEADAGVPLTTSSGLGLLARAGVAFRL